MKCIKYTQPKPIVRTNIQCKPHKIGQTIANIAACISYSTGLQYYFNVRVKLIDHKFLTFEETIIFCDLNNYWFDAQDWSNPNIGINKFYSIENKVRLDNGQVIEINDEIND